MFAQPLNQMVVAEAPPQIGQPQAQIFQSPVVPMPMEQSQGVSKDPNNYLNPSFGNQNVAFMTRTGVQMVRCWDCNRYKDHRLYPSLDSLPSCNKLGAKTVAAEANLKSDEKH